MPGKNGRPAPPGHLYLHPLRFAAATNWHIVRHDSTRFGQGPARDWQAGGSDCSNTEHMGTDMKQQASCARQRGIGVVATIVLALVLGVVLIGGLYWWSTRPAGEAPATPATPGPIAEQPAEPVIPVGDPGELAEKAMQEKRMFVPPGDNAFELYLRVADADPNNVQARNALGELFPYAVLFVEQRIAAGDVVDGERVVALMQRADAAAPALPRLSSALADLRTRQAQQLADTERRAAEAAAAADAARAAAATAAATPAASTAPPPAAPAVPDPVPSAPDPAPETVAEAAPPVTQAPASAPAPAPASQPPPRLGGLPAVVSSVQPDYPVRASRRRIEGKVELQFTVQPDGSVTDVTVVSSKPLGMFDREAIAAMERWRFAPQQNASRGRRVFDFKLN